MTAGEVAEVSDNNEVRPFMAKFRLKEMQKVQCVVPLKSPNNNVPSILQ